MIDQLRKNIETEVEMLKEISSYSSMIERSGPVERKVLSESLTSLQASMKLINNSIPQILSNISLAKKLPSKSDATNLEKVSFKGSKNEINVVLNSKDKERFFRELSISDDAIKKLRKGYGKGKEEYEEFKGSRGYIKLSNKLFFNQAGRLIKKGHFRSMALDLQKSNMDILLESYVSMMFFTSFLAIFVGIILFVVLIFFDLSFAFPFISMGDASAYGKEAIKLIWLPLVFPPLVFWTLYIYPSTEKSSIEKRIDQELPFAVIHMSAISGAGIEPTNIFKIIALSRDYPYLRKEIRKILNQLNLYGYDLVTALNDVSRITPSVKFSELLSGLSTTISSGGELSNFLEKRAETLLITYRLEREKFTKVAETFMDIYITVAIAAPMILLLIMIMLSISDFDLGLSPGFLTGLLIGAIALINVVFLFILRIKQPSY